MSARVAVVGRPNVGKSTLFNRLVGKKLAIVDSTPGVTRDWREAPAQLMDLSFTAIDTAGLEEAFDDSMEGRMRRQTEAALFGVDVVIMMVDARAGITPMDRHFAQWFHRQGFPVVLVANKCEGQIGETGRLEAFELGLGEPVGLSAEHALGWSDLRDVLAPFVKDKENQEEEEGDADKPLRTAIVGRPNVGKSTLVNKLVGAERMMTGPEPGVTRDAVHIDWSWRDTRFRLVDTAGIRRRSRLVEKLEKTAVDDALRAIRLAEIVFVVLDAERALDKQDMFIAAKVIEEGRALVIVVNKWDLVTDRAKFLKKLKNKLTHVLPQVKDIPVVTISALDGRGLNGLMKQALETCSIWNKRVSTGPLNRWLADMEQAHPPPLASGRVNRLRYISQIKSRPPTFNLWASRPEELPDSYLRYLTNGIRAAFDLPGVPIRLVPKRGKNPYADKT